MKRHKYFGFQGLTAAGGAMLLFLAASTLMADEPAPAATAAYNAYVSKVEARIHDQHGSGASYLVPEDRSRLRRGELMIDQLTPGTGAELPGALLHDWRGTAFVPGAKAADFERLMEDFNGYPKIYAPEVLTARVLARDGEDFQVTMRVAQKHVLTVVMDTAYEVTFGRDDSGGPGGQLTGGRGYSISRSTRIAEIDSPGSANEHALSPGEAHGFLWRQNTYWSYEERDGGLYVQIESVSLSRSIPTGLGWAIGPFIESVPRESVEFTLRATCDALRR